MRRTLSIAAIVVFVLAVNGPPAQAGPDDPYFSRQWGLARIRADQAWAVANGAGVTIAIVDTGVDLSHPDLASKLVSAPDADFSGDLVSDGPQDENGHGTHVAGIAAAITGNGTGVAGAAPGASILPVRVLDADGSGTAEEVARGVRYAADHGAQVINLSLGFASGTGEVGRLTGALDSLYDAIDYAWAQGAVVVIAAGNDSVPLCAEPAAAPKALCVGATDANDVRSFYSNSDVTMTRPFLVAPGGDGLTCSGGIFSTYLRSAPPSVCSDASGYDAIAGTSMATPFVSGVAALLAEQGLSNAAIVSCLEQSADDLGAPGRDPIYGYGRVNALAAVTTC